MRKIKNKKSLLIFFVVFLFFSIVGFVFWASDKYVTPILMYHHIDGKAYLELTTVSPESFDKQMAYLKKNGYKVVHFDELVKAAAQGKKLPRKSIVITFDDGNLDNYLYAFPILKKYGFSAMFFVPTDLLGMEGFMTWDQLKVMVEAGMEAGSHTRTHMFLPTYPSLQKVRDEITESKKILEDKLGIEIEYFCYPSGGFDDDIKNMLKEAGYKAACTTNRGYDRYNKDLFELKRIRMKDNNTSTFDLRAKYSGYYNLFRRLRKPYSR